MELYLLIPMGLAVAFFVWLTIANLIHKRKPIIDQKATVLAKRQEVTGTGSAAAFTSYYVTFELEGDERVEFPVEGRHYGLIMESDKGTLSTRGNVFESFQRHRLLTR